jgi:hypothetical protein
MLFGIQMQPGHFCLWPIFIEVLSKFVLCLVNNDVIVKIFMMYNDATGSVFLSNLYFKEKKKKRYFYTLVSIPVAVGRKNQYIWH